MTDHEITALHDLAGAAQRHAHPVDPALVRRSGAERRRRRTAAVAGLAALVLVAGVGGAVALGGGSDGTGTDRDVAGTPVEVLGPEGYGDVRLGMSADDAERTGLVTVQRAAPAAACETLVYVDHPPAGDAEVSGFVSRKHGVAALFAAPGMETPEGIGLGDSLADVETAYPDLVDTVNAQLAPLPGEPARAYHFGVDRTGVVVELSLQLDVQDCIG